MSFLLRMLAGLALAAAPFLPIPDIARAQTATTQGQGPYAHPIVAKDAERLDARIKREAALDVAGARRSAETLRRAGAALLDAKGDAREAARFLMLSLATEPESADGWQLLSRAFLAIAPDRQKGEQYELPPLVSGAAFRAYERATNPTAKADALTTLSNSLKLRSLWRPALEALKVAVALEATPTRRDALDKMRAEHGFRMVDYKVDADSAEPRLCLNFSERLADAPQGLASFVSVDGRDPQNVVADGQQICVEGLAHGKRYEVKVRAGLPSVVGESLLKTAELAVYVRDRSPAVRFSGRAYVLPSHGQQGIPVVTVNAKTVAVEIFRIGDRGLATAASGDNFLRQLQRYEIDNLRERLGQHVWKGQLDVVDKLNEDVTTAIPVNEALPTLQPGVYVLTAKIPRKGSGEDDHAFSSGASAAQWFIISDLGLTAMNGADGVHAFVRTLGSATPAANVTVRLVARNNEVLGTAKTNAAGYARFASGLARGEGAMAPALLIAEGTNDYAFLDLTTAAFDLSDRGVKGRETPGPIDAYLFAERGVYRPGETLHLTALVRDQSGKAASLPATLVLTRPDGVEHRRQLLPDQGLGGRALSYPLPSTAMTGTWRARIYADPKGSPLSQTSFLVEDFVPERLALKLDPITKTLVLNENGKVAVDGRYLYGPPAAELDLEGEIVVRPATALPGFPGYQFGLSDERVTPVRRPLEDLGKTDANGRAEVAFQLPPVQRTARPLEADIRLRLREPGGRAIERSLTLPVSLGEPRIGARALFKNGAVAEGETAELDVILLGADGKPVPASSFKWQLSRLDQRWLWYQRDGQWSFEAVTSARKLQNGTSEAKDGKPARIALDTRWGRYRLDITSDAAPGALTSVTFRSGWYQAENTESPEQLEVALDKASYKAGDTAKLRIVSREAGKALIAVLSNGLLASEQVEVPKGGTEVAIAVKQDWLPGAYVTATLYRALDEKSRRMPSRAIGVSWLSLDTSSNTLAVTMETKAQVRPGQGMDVPLQITGLAPGEDARVTVAAVDVGVLNLTRYQAPKPEGWFLAQRRLGTELRDFYGRLIDGMRAERGKLRSGGDDSAPAGLKGNPPVEKPLALFSGIVTVGTDGKALVNFELPDFNGTVRLMAVAWSASKVGSGQADVIVRDRLALTVSAPRFLTLGDTSRLAVDVHNVDGPAANYAVTIARTGSQNGGNPQSMGGQDVALKANERRQVPVALKPTGLGRHVYSVRVTGPEGIEVKRNIALEVMPPAADIKRATIAKLAARTGRIEISKDILADLIPGTARLTLNVGPTAALDVASLIGQLDRYPYGCAEQTTSRALPLLYVNEMAQRIGLANDTQIRARITGAIERVLEMQDASGAFGIWGPNSSGDLWLTAYVTDFLTRAKEQGFEVRARRFTQALDKLANALSYSQDFERGGEARAYALYVLARNGRAPIGDLRYDVDTRLARFATPLAQAQLGAALSMVGEKDRAQRAFGAALTALEASAAKGETFTSRNDYGSLVRDGAALLTLASETGLMRQRTADLATVLAKAYQTRTYTSTQEQAWMLLAARALSEAAKATTLSIDGKRHTGELMRVLAAADLERGPMTVVNSGDASVDAALSVVGAALTPEPAIEKGFRIERSYYKLDGTKVDLASATGGRSRLAQNERLVAVLTITGEHEGGRVLLVDRLPAGLEIENPRLVDGGDLKGLDWLKRDKQPEHTEFRDDRLVAAFNFQGQTNRRGQSSGTLPSASVAYIVRAVTPGSYVHPAATVEDMYRPERFARSAAGRLDVTPAGR
ncbi:MAG: alpha-2-macroglobulin [Hyphomicrobiaceae bacterium]